MEDRRFIKKLDVPSGFTVPTTLIYDDIVARAISRADLHEDVKGINASIELIRRTWGGGWPSEAVTEEFNFRPVDPSTGLGGRSHSPAP